MSALLLSDERRDLIESATRFAQDKFARLEPGQDEFPREVFAQVAEQGWAGLCLPEEDGGQGGSLLDAVLTIEAFARVSPVAADVIQALNFGAIQQLARCGSDDLKARYLVPCLAGEKVITVAMTEAEAGSAVTDLKTQALLAGDGPDDPWVVNGTKIFTTHAAHADCFVIWTRFGKQDPSTGAVLIERETPGFTVDATHRFMTGEAYGMLYFDDVRVPQADVLVERDGFRRLLPIFNIERLGNASRALGLGQCAFDLAVEYMKERRQFGRRLAEFQGLQWRIAEMKLQLESARLLLYRAASMADAGVPSALETALAKVACNRAGFQVADQALQVFGGHGFDQEAKVNYIFRRTRGWMIAGGTIEAMLNRIASDVFGERFSQRKA